MGVFDNDLTLPGAITDIQSDYNYGYDTSLFGTTDSVTIIGTAFNGPVGVQVPIYSPEHSRYIFGKSYDSATRREATLVAEVENAWERGCRTIYAVRVSGKAIYKDFQFAYDTNLKLRVAGMFPSNSNKDIYMQLDSTVGNQVLTMYKPASRATIQEKMMGLVQNEDDILPVVMKLDTSYGMTSANSIIDLIKVVNEHPYNNVIRLSIIDENGNDVTSTSSEAQALPIKAMFQGVYFIGRDKSTVSPITLMDVQFIPATTVSGASATIGALGAATTLKSITINTDINTDFPITAKDSALLVARFAAAGVSLPNAWDVLLIPGKVSELFIKDSVDYEEVQISDFDLYKRLGSGYAITATVDSAAFAASGAVKIRETATDDSNRIVPIEGGIYSMLENLKSDYRVLSNATADKAITSKFPKKDEFKVAQPTTTKLFGIINAKSKVEAKSFTAPRTYRVTLKQDSSIDTTIADVKTTLMVDIASGVVQSQNFAKRVGALETLPTGVVFKNGDLFLLGDMDAATPTLTLIRFNGSTFDKLEDATLIPNGKLFIGNDRVFESKKNTVSNKVEFIDATTLTAAEKLVVDDGDSLSVYAAAVAAGKVTAVPVCPLKAVFATDIANEVFVVTQNVATHDVGAKNEIYVVSSAFDYTTLSDFVDELNSTPELDKLFSFSIVSDQGSNANIDIIELVAGLDTNPVVSAVFDNKTITYDTSLYIPYKTTDNFARHLAQHCQYTSLKTSTTHGVIGCSKLVDVNLNSVAAKVDELMTVDTSYYAKKANGNDMLDRNNMPYPIGRNISVLFGQYIMATSDNYNFVSSAAAGYAGMVSILALDQSSTNQPISIPDPMFELNNYQLEKLTQKGFVTFKNSYTKGWVITDGVTMAPVTSPFRRLLTTRIVNAVEEIIRAAVEPYIGKPNNLANRNSMTTAIRSKVGDLIDKLLQSFDFKVVTDPSNMNLGIIDIDYVLVTLPEIRQVRNRMTVKESV